MIICNIGQPNLGSTVSSRQWKTNDDLWNLLVFVPEKSENENEKDRDESVLLIMMHSDRTH
jgi:hypothetical protein